MNRHTMEVRPFRQQRWVQLLARGLLIGLLIVPLTLALPGTVHVAHAAQLEDCDADGFDDSTGVAVPWPGYDETRGDTPAGPGTADWWIAQNKPSGATSGDSSSGGGGTGAGSDSGGSNSGGSGGSTPARSGGSGSGATGGRTTTSPQATTPAAAGPNAAAVSAASSTVTSAPASAASSASAETSGAAAAASTSGGGGAAAGSAGLWEALTVGFTGANRELLAGLSLLVALALAGGLALGISALRGFGSRSLLRESDVPQTEEAVAGIA